MIEKASELQAQNPCDSTCNPTTHCCLDLLGGGGSGGLPIPGGGSSGLPIPGFEAGIPGGGSSGSPLPGADGVCVTK